VENVNEEPGFSAAGKMNVKVTLRLMKDGEEVGTISSEDRILPAIPNK
jgi:hypothetical protein